MDMNEDLMAPPSPDDAPDGGAPPADDQTSKDPSEAHYRGPEARCYSCEYFQEPGTCSKGVNGGTVDPEAGCDLFEQADDGSGTGPDTDDQENQPS